MTIQLQAWSGKWAGEYKNALFELRSTLGPGVAVEHVGSTAIDGIDSKPVVDVLIGLASGDAVSPTCEKLRLAGWRPGVPSGDVSAFLERDATADLPALNAHITVQGDQAWSDLLAFRYWLQVHPSEAQAYQALKRKAAVAHCDDLNAYTEMKGPFVREVLAAVGLVNDTLTQQRDALGRSIALRCLSIALQLIIATAAMVSVLTNDSDTLVVLGGLTLLLIGSWLWSDWACRKHRGDGEQARRLIQIEYGLGHRVAERSFITASFSPRSASIKPVTIDQNFATRAAPGMRRLAEMIDESAFFSAATQKKSAVITVFFLVIAAVSAFLGFLFLGPHLDQSVLSTTIRAFMALAVFMMSADVVGALVAHHQACSSMEAIRMRISAARGRQFPVGDVLQAMADYNASVEGAPPPLPFIYEVIERELLKKWKIHKTHVGIGEI